MAAPTIEDRLSALERDVSWLKQKLKRPVPPSIAEMGSWLDAISGSFKDDPEFDEVIRLGKLARAADAPDEEQAP